MLDDADEFMTRGTLGVLNFSLFGIPPGTGEIRPVSSHPESLLPLDERFGKCNRLRNIGV
jgi:hypothetical protein